MFVLIAESKTMAPCDRAISPEEYAAHTPALENQADAIMTSLRDMTAAELSKRVKLSPAMALRLQTMIREFPHKALGGSAIEAFTGVVFKAFGSATLDEEAARRTCRSVRIVSSLYGWLKPDDIVKPYRFDFTTPLAPGGTTFAAMWREPVTDCLLAELKASGETGVLDLLPGDAARCIDWKRVAARAEVRKADFQEVRPDGSVRTPNAGRLKTLRGLLLRQIVCEDIESSEQLMTLQSEHYMAEDAVGVPGHIVFSCLSD